MKALDVCTLLPCMDLTGVSLQYVRTIHGFVQQPLVGPIVVDLGTRRVRSMEPRVRCANPPIAMVG